MYTQSHTQKHTIQSNAYSCEEQVLVLNIDNMYIYIYIDGYIDIYTNTHAHTHTHTRTHTHSHTTHNLLKQKFSSRLLFASENPKADWSEEPKPYDAGAVSKNLYSGP